MRDLQLNNAARVTLNGSGAGQAQAGPTSPGESWQLAGIYVSASSNVSEAQCYCYIAGVGPFIPGPSQGIGATSTGSTGDTMGPAGSTIWPGQQIIAIWSGGDAGAVATLSYWGTRQVP